MQTEFHATVFPPYARLHVSGELDLANLDQLADALECLRLCGCSRTEVDAAGVTFVDAASLRVLHAEQRRQRAAGGDLVVVAASRAFDFVVRVADYEDLRAPTVTGPVPARLPAWVAWRSRPGTARPSGRLGRTSSG